LPVHLLRGQSRELEAAEEAVDLGQSPGDIIVLTAADTEIAGLAAARRALPEDFPSVRLANWMALAHPYSVDLYAERVLAQAKLVVVRLLGGVSYWRYGVEEAQRLARAGGPRLALLPGDATWDEGLAGEGTLPAGEARRLWSYLAEGGSANLRNALSYCAHLIGRGEPPPDPEPLPTTGHYEITLSHGALESPPTAAIVFYRALVQAGQTEPVDALCEALAERGLRPLPLFVSSLKAAEDAAFVERALAEAEPAVVLNATAFALSSAGGDFAGTVLDGGRRPVLQVTFAGSSEAAWAESARGLSAKDLTMNVVLPEIDGRLITRAVSFKEEGGFDPLTECRPVRYRPALDRIAFVAELARRWADLARIPNADKRVAIVLANYPNRDGRIANGVGLDAPQSTAKLIAALAERGYDVGEAPRSGRELMELILSGPTNARGAANRSGFLSTSGSGQGEGANVERNGQKGPSPGRFAAGLSPQGRGISIADYLRHFQGLPDDVQRQVEERWGPAENDSFVEDGTFVLPVHRFGNLVVGIQPARGYNIDPKSTYHDPDLVPPHGYFAFYIWLREAFGTHAVVQMGKHGNLEWLPGKALALSASCYPEAALGPLPLVYPFIVNDPGEGAQAKRRTSAVIVDHLMPPMARAEAYGPAAELERLIDEYAAAQAADPRRAGLLAEQIFDLASAHGFLADLGFAAGERDEAALARLDEHLCDLKELQIRDGLHVLGEGPAGRQRAETLVALARVPRGAGEGGRSLLRALAVDLGLDGFDPLACAYAEPWTGPRPAILDGAVDAPWRTNGDTIERLEALALALVEGAPLACDFLPREAGEGDHAQHGGGGGHRRALRSAPSTACGGPPPPLRGGGSMLAGLANSPATRSVLDELATRIAPALDASGKAEIDAVCTALDGRFVPPGPSGAPTRGRPDCLPTGRNFYSVDVRAVPTPAAFDLGRRSADLIAERYFQDEGEWPTAIALSAWGTSNMRTGGDDIAQALALIGAKPVWEPASGRVTGVEVILLAELGRPRIDVTLRISGFFRDAFPAQIELFHQAVQAVAERDEPADANPIAHQIAADAAGLAAAGIPQAEARKAASFRVFGSKPGAYGAGLQALIDEGIWSERRDLAAAFLEWSAYAYGGGAEGEGARPALERQLKAADAVVHNQDNREHDLLDSDDYYQFEGGLAAAVETLKGAAPRIYHNDHSRPERPLVRALDEEIARVVRGRAANPKWIAGQMRHGYKGAVEMAATVDYLFAFAATTDAVRPHHFDQLYDAYLGDAAVRDFIAEANPPALAEMAARFREAIDRGLWAPRRNSAYDELKAIAEEARR
jgi:cobaltochelatase CobN